MAHSSGLNLTMLTDPKPDTCSRGLDQILSISSNAQEPTQPAVSDVDGQGVDHMDNYEEVENDDGNVLQMDASEQAAIASSIIHHSKNQL